MASDGEPTTTNPRARGVSMTDDVPLICDPVPCYRLMDRDRPMSFGPDVSEMQAAKMQEAFKRYCDFNAPQWPDAEFCAA